MILITGATGFVGTALVRRLAARGTRHLACLVRPGRAAKPLLDIAKDAEGMTIDIRNTGLSSAEEIAPALRGVTLVYHLAAAMSGSAADMTMSTVVGSKNLLEAIAANKKMGIAPPRVVLVSSMAVYGVANLPRRAIVSEETIVEPHPTRRDIYTQSKLRQERLFRDYKDTLDLPLVIVRPGVIYGEGGGALSSRVGIDVFGVFLNLGGRNLLPLTHVENCVDAIAIAGERGKDGEAYNIVDDDLPTCNEYLAAYRHNVRNIVSVRVPYPALQVLSRAVSAYSRLSKGQLPPILTPYRAAASWKGNRFENTKIKGLGWRPLIPTSEGILRALAWQKERSKP